MKINILIVDDHKIFRDGLSLNFASVFPGYKICGEASSREELMNLLMSGPLPDLILLDNLLTDSTGIDITAFLKKNDPFKNIKIIILSAMKAPQMGTLDYEYVIAAIEAGADGYLLKDSSIDQIGQAVEEVMQGGGFFLGETFNFKEATRVIISNQNKMIRFLKKERNFGLTPREVEVIKYLSEGMSAKEIASKMCITEDVVTSFKDNIKRKLSENHNVELKNMVEMVVWAIKNQVISI
ncbi:MAG TPA: response regulator transcription factor [Bacteroidales bacterium]|nr:response regulator transcription factor [Bacteroidales bacterium]HPB25831.1 response regulator transcription factor [Bacteroidales bacterium]HPI30589.1 response regulator transcription factor [Bacteroidales bacterium]HQN16449.1 response regulator transcription factor [Bacteroidales bacterium]HQP16138.1 response regulator transcription factor [Bacteroidales bacterium]